MKKEFMLRAIELAKISGAEGEIPVGAVIVKDGVIIAEGRNMRESKQSALSHAEIEAIAKANEVLCDWRLSDCEMYVTLEPCAMCAGAIINSRIKTLIFGAFDKTFGCADSALNLFSALNSKTELYCGIMETECKSLLDDFFNTIR